MWGERVQSRGGSLHSPPYSAEIDGSDQGEMGGGLVGEWWAVEFRRWEERRRKFTKRHYHLVHM